MALYEAVFNCMESLLPEYGAVGYVRERSGSALPGIAPSNLYPCKDGLCPDRRQRRQHLQPADDRHRPRRPARRSRARAQRRPRGADAAIDAAIGAWTSKRTQDEVLEELDKAEVPAGRIYTVADIAADPHYAARGMIQEVVAGDGEPLKVPGIVPKLSATPGAIRSPAPKLGEHTDEVLRRIGYASAEIEKLKESKII